MLTLTARAHYPCRTTTQMRPSHRRIRDPLGGRQPPSPPVRGRVCRQRPLPRELEGVLDVLLAVRVMLA